MAQILVNCPKCGKPYQVDDNSLGRKATCSACHKPFTLSAKSTPEAPPKTDTASHAAPSAGTSAGARPKPKTGGGQGNAAKSGGHADKSASKARTPKKGSSSITAGTVDPDRFEVIEELGAGAFGTVYKARDRQLDRLVALKIPRLGALGSKSDVHRFLSEARAAGSLRHPNIVPIHDAGKVAGSYFIASAYIEGHSLEEQILSGARLSQQQVARLVRTLAEALHYAHGQGIVHRDVKPPNIMIDTEGRPLLMDFGMARRVEGETLLTQEGARIGTPAYMSPEQHAGQSHLADARSDQWALGVLLYELLAGCRPFSAPSEVQIGYAVRHEEPDRPRKIKKTIARDLETICLQCLEKDPDERYASCQDLADDLGRWLAGQPIAACPPDVVEQSWRWVVRHRTQCSFAAVSLLFVFVVALLFGVMSRPAELRLAPIPDHRILTNEEFRVRARLTNPAAWTGRARFKLCDGAPEGAQLDSQSGQLRFRNSQPGSFPITIRAVSVDDPERRDETSFTVTVCEPIPAPVLAAIDSQKVEPGGEVRVQPVVKNRSEIPCDVHFDMSAGLASRASLNSESGEYVWKVPHDQQPALYAVTLRATADWPGEPSATTTFAVRVTDDASRPLLTLEPIKARTVRPGEAVRFRVEATDHRRPPHEISFTLVDPPQGAAISSENGEFTWTAADTHAGKEHPIRIRATTVPPEPLIEEMIVAINVESPPSPKPKPADEKKQPPKSDPLKPKVPWKRGRQAVLAEMRRPTECEFIEVPLRNVLDRLIHEHGIPIYLDARALDDVGIGSDTPVTAQARKQPLGDALTALLKDLSLRWSVWPDGVVHVTTPEDQAMHIWTRVYRLGNRADPDTTFNSIQRNVSPASWDRSGGPGCIAGLVLPRAAVIIVSQTEEVLQQIDLRYGQLLRAATLPEDPWSKPPGHGRSTPSQALLQLTELDFIETSLRDVMDSLSNRHKTTIRIDEQALDKQFGMSADDLPITFRMGGIRLRAGLRMMLSNLWLTYLVDDREIVITTPEATEQRVLTKSYGVKDLAAANPQSFVDVLMVAVSPAYWDQVGGPGTMRLVPARGTLMVKCSASVHEELADVLSKLRLANK